MEAWRWRPVGGHAMIHVACAEHLPPGHQGTHSGSRPVIWSSGLSTFGVLGPGRPVSRPQLPSLPLAAGTADEPPYTRTTPSAESLRLCTGSELEGLKKKKKNPEDL